MYKLFQVTLYLDRESYNGFSLKEEFRIKIPARNSASAISKARYAFRNRTDVSIRNVSCYELESEDKRS